MSQVGKDQAFFDEFPDNPGHFIVHFDNGVFDFDFAHLGLQGSRTCNRPKRRILMTDWRFLYT